jgi:hypothetical protein
MRYWWVNQNQTYRHEVPGGYLWSPKRKTNGGRNPFYDFMREVAPGDIIFSFADTRIKAIGIVASHAYEAPKPLAFGQAGAHWNMIGWRVDVSFAVLQNSIRPSEHMTALAPVLPRRYAPLTPDGNGLQSVYLTHLPETFAGTLVDLIGVEARNIVLSHRVSEEAQLRPEIGLVEWEEHELSQLRADMQVPQDRPAGSRTGATRSGLVQGASNADRTRVPHHRRDS